MPLIQLLFPESVEIKSAAVNAIGSLPTPLALKDLYKMIDVELFTMRPATGGLVKRDK